MEHFAKLAEFGFVPIQDDSDERESPPSFLEPRTYQEGYSSRFAGVETLSPASALSSNYDHLQQHSERCSSVETVSSVTSVYMSSPVTSYGDMDFVYSGQERHLEIDIKQAIEHPKEISLLNRNGKRELESDDVVPPPKKQTGGYKRYPKPPYTYVGLIVTAIQNSRDKQLTLTGVNNWLQDNFVFFRGEYTGWKDSVRHNLSHSKCFYKDILESTTGKNRRKLNLWRVDLSKITEDIFRRQENAVGKSGFFAPYIHAELGLPPVLLPHQDTSADYYATVSHKPPTGKAHRINEHSNAYEDNKENVNVKLPRKFRSWNKVVDESPEVLRQSSSADRATDTPKTTSKETNHQYETITPSTRRFPSETDTPLITPEISHIIDYLTSMEQNIPTQDAVQNLSLLCSDSSQNQLDLNTSFQEREEDCLEKSLMYRDQSSEQMNPFSTRGNADENRSFLAVPTNSYPYYPVLHQGSSQNFSDQYTSETNMYDPQQTLVHHPLICQFQHPQASNFYSHLHYSSPMTLTPSFYGYSPYPVCDTAVTLNNYPAQYPSYNTPDQEDNAAFSNTVDKDLATDDVKTNYVFDQHDNLKTENDEVVVIKTEM